MNSGRPCWRAERLRPSRSGPPHSSHRKKMRILITWLCLCLLGVTAGCSSPPVTLALLGDIQLGRGVAQAHADGSWEEALSYLEPALAGADLALANLESPLSDQPLPYQGEGYNLCAPAESVHALAAAGIDLLALANNHVDDCRPGGVPSTLNILETAGLAGITEAANPVMRSINGVPLAMLVFDDVSTPLEEKAALQAVRQADQSADLVVVSMHWGAEYQAAPTPSQRALAHSLAEAGADLIWGHHPHVLQPLEYLPRPNGQPPALAAYSLGNALFDQPGSADTNRSAVLLVKMDRQGVQSFEILPFEIDPLRGVATEPSRESAQAVEHILNFYLSRD